MKWGVGRLPLGFGLSTSSMKSADAGPFPSLTPDVRKSLESGIYRAYCFHMFGHGDDFGR